MTEAQGLREDNASRKPDVAFSRPFHGGLIIHITGDWKLERQLPSHQEVKTELESTPPVEKLSFDAEDLGDWDSSLVLFLKHILELCNDKNIIITSESLPQGVLRLINLASSGAERVNRRQASTGPSFFSTVGNRALHLWASTVDVFTFLGEVVVAFGRLLAGKARFRWSDFVLVVQDTGAKAFPIVSLISLLVGLILAFVGSIQLKMFGAQIYIADLVAIAMARAMGAIMTGIIMAGRTGASFAAGIGTMQVSEEIDALRTAGLPPMEFLVLPRIFALALMMPLLTLYANLMGILGGMIVGVGGFGIGALEYYNETKGALTLTTIGIGLFSSFVFGILISISGCLRGIQCGRSASAVGDATTSAVVTSIVSIIVATAIITIGCDILGI